jgi:hypothetical protein
LVADILGHVVINHVKAQGIPGIINELDTATKFILDYVKKTATDTLDVFKKDVSSIFGGEVASFGEHLKTAFEIFTVATGGKLLTKLLGKLYGGIGAIGKGIGAVVGGVAGPAAGKGVVGGAIAGAARGGLAANVLSKLSGYGWLAYEGYEKLFNDPKNPTFPLALKFLTDPSAILNAGKNGKNVEEPPAPIPTREFHDQKSAQAARGGAFVGGGLTGGKQNIYEKPKLPDSSFTQQSKSHDIVPKTKIEGVPGVTRPNQPEAQNQTSWQKFWAWLTGKDAATQALGGSGSLGGGSRGGGGYSGGGSNHSYGPQEPLIKPTKSALTSIEEARKAKLTPTGIDRSRFAEELRNNP